MRLVVELVVSLGGGAPYAGHEHSIAWAALPLSVPSPSSLLLSSLELSDAKVYEP